MSKIERAKSSAESNTNFCVPEWRKIGYDDTYEDAQLLHNCMTKRLKKEDDPDYAPDSQADGDSPRSINGQGQYFQKPIFQCPECVRSYKSPVRMANHYRDKHPDKDPRTPYSRHSSSQREKRHTYDYTTSPPLSPDVDSSYSQYSSSYDYNHKHTRHERGERFTANENTSQLISPMFHRASPRSTSSNNSPYSNALVPVSRGSPDASPPLTPVDSPASPAYSPPSHSPIPIPHTKPESKENEKAITVNGRTYELKGIRISTVVDEFKFVECLEKNKQRLHLANIAYSQGLISSEEYARKQREFLSAFSFF